MHMIDGARPGSPEPLRIHPEHEVVNYPHTRFVATLFERPIPHVARFIWQTAETTLHTLVDDAVVTFRTPHHHTGLLTSSRASVPAPWPTSN